jgi:DNA-binding response OmpR family regulator
MEIPWSAMTEGCSVASELVLGACLGGTTNGDDALADYQLERSSYDIVIPDHSHLGLFGIELIALIRERNPAQPPVLQAGDCGEHIEGFRQQHRDIPFLEKPYRRQQMQDLAAAIRRQRAEGK